MKNRGLTAKGLDITESVVYEDVHRRSIAKKAIRTRRLSKEESRPALKRALLSLTRRRDAYEIPEVQDVFLPDSSFRPPNSFRCRCGGSGHNQPGGFTDRRQRPKNEGQRGCDSA